MLAASKGNNDSLQALIDNHANLDVTRAGSDGKTALILAAEQGNSQGVTALAQAGANPNIQGIDKATNKATGTALMALIQQAHDSGQKPDVTAVKALINANPTAAGLNELDQDGRTAMMRAASFGQKDVVMALVDAKANPDIQDKQTGRTAIMDLLANSDPNKPLQRFEAEALVKASSKPDLEDKQHRTALMEAGKHGQGQTIVALVDSKRVNVDKQDVNGRTALMELGSSETPATGVDMSGAKSLIHASKDLNKQDKNGKTALMEMCQARSDSEVDAFSDAVREMNKAGADLNKKDTNGKTALMYAAASGNRQGVRYLLDTDFASAGKVGLHKADPSIKDNKQMSALDHLNAAIANVTTLSGEEKKTYDDITDMLKHAPVPPHAAPSTKLPDWQPKR